MVWMLAPAAWNVPTPPQPNYKFIYSLNKTFQEGFLSLWVRLGSTWRHVATVFLQPTPTEPV